MKNPNQLSILRTDIKTKKKVKVIQLIFKQHSQIVSWSIDIEDIDNVLRIEHATSIKENDIISILKKSGFYSEPLKD